MFGFECPRCECPRLANHRSDIKLNKDTAVTIHFNSHDTPFDLRSLEAVVIERITASKDSKKTRLKKRKNWQELLGTQYPLGLNAHPTAPESVRVLSV